MTTQLDCSIGLKKETTWGTGVVVDRFPEFVSEKLTWNPTFKQGAGLRVGSRAARNARRSLVKQSAGGDIEIEAATKGLGIFFEALLGTSVSTQIGAGPGYQQVHTLTTTALPSYTIQKGVPTIAGAVSAHTFNGAVCASGELSASNADIVKFSTKWDAKEVKTDVSYAAPSYVAGAELFTFVHGAIALGGSVTAPTTTALATGGTTAANITDFKISIDNKIDGGGFVFGSGGKRGRKPLVGLAEIKGSVTAEFDSNTLRDAWLNQTPLSLTLTLQTATAITTGVYPTIQVYVPIIKLEGDIPMSNGGDVITQSIDFTGLFDGSTEPIYLVYRTEDTAI